MSIAMVATLSLPLLLGPTTNINAASLPKPSLGPSIPMNLTDLYSTISNTTTLGDGGIDPRFTINYQLGLIPLRPIACLMNAVSAMTNLALQDFDAMVSTIISRLPSYPDVMIRSDPKHGGLAFWPIRFVLWGIWSFALFMMSRDSFQTMLLTLAFDGIIVGYVRVDMPGPQVSRLAGSGDDNSSVESLKERTDVASPVVPLSETVADFTMTSNSSSPSLTNSTTTTPSNAGDLRVFIDPIGDSLTDSEFFTPILAGLDYVARFPSTAPVQGFRLRSADTDTWIEFRDFGLQPRVTAPFFEYQWVARALGELPVHIALLGRWSEAVVVLQVDGVRVGDGWIRKGQW